MLFFRNTIMKIFSHVTGNTLGIHRKFLQKLTKRGAKVVDIIDKAKAIIVFCPLVSRYETDILSALSSIPGRHPETQPHMEKFSYVCLFAAFNCDLCFLSVTKNQNVRLWFWWWCSTRSTKTRFYHHTETWAAVHSLSTWTVCFMSKWDFWSALAMTTRSRWSANR